MAESQSFINNGPNSAFRRRIGAANEGNNTTVILMRSSQKDRYITLRTVAEQINRTMPINHEFGDVGAIERRFPEPHQRRRRRPVHLEEPYYDYEEIDAETNFIGTKFADVLHCVAQTGNKVIIVEIKTWALQFNKLVRVFSVLLNETNISSTIHGQHPDPRIECYGLSVLVTLTISRVITEISQEDSRSKSLWRLVSTEKSHDLEKRLAEIEVEFFRLRMSFTTMAIQPMERFELANTRLKDLFDAKKASNNFVRIKLRDFEEERVPAMNVVLTCCIPLIIMIIAGTEITKPSHLCGILTKITRSFCDSDITDFDLADLVGSLCSKVIKPLKEEICEWRPGFRNTLAAIATGGFAVLWYAGEFCSRTLLCAKKKEEALEPF